MRWQAVGIKPQHLKRPATVAQQSTSYLITLDVADAGSTYLPAASQPVKDE